MQDFAQFVAPPATLAGESSVSEASDCLDRFTAAFNDGDLARMDAQLAFPHIMLSGAACLAWTEPGQHPPDFFHNLKASGWAKTEYVRKEVVLASADKVHFVVTYEKERVGRSAEHSRESMDRCESRKGLAHCPSVLLNCCV
jgi:hypothetical protein